MLPITDLLLTSTKNRPATRRSGGAHYFLRKLKGVVIHWTANTGRGADARANRNYFNQGLRFASAHYIVDDHEIVRCIPDNEVAYHVGGRFYKPMGEAIREEGLTPNYFLIGIEMCVNSDGDWDKTYQNTVELTQHLLNKYSFTIRELYRHYDITGKLCPRMMIDESDWQKFKMDVNAGLNFQVGNPIKRGFINTADLNVRKGNGIQFAVIDELHQDDKIEVFEELGNWYRIGDDRWVHKHYVQITFESMEGLVDVDETKLNVRTGPGVRNAVVDSLKDGTKINIIDVAGKWYKIGTDRWVHSGYVQVVEIQNGRVVFADFLNVRKGPGTNFEKVRQLPGDSLVKIIGEEGNWFQIGEDEWVYNSFIEVVS